MSTARPGAAALELPRCRRAARRRPAPSPPSPPRTIIVIDDSPSEVSSFLCSVLDAHALPYAVQVIDPGAPALMKSPTGIKYMLATLCSNPAETKAEMGKMMERIRSVVERAL